MLDSFVQKQSKKIKPDDKPTTTTPNLCKLSTPVITTVM